jgi:6-hydroxytryprostatin B O-methyltransferase
LHRFQIANAIPVDGKASYAEISKTTGLQETKLRTILRHAMTLGLFIDNGDNTASHTATSAAVATQPFVADNLGFTMQDCFPASAKLADALEKFGDSGEPNHSAFNLAFHTQDPLFDWLAKNEVSGTRYSRVMKGMAEWEALDKKHILEGFDWESRKEGIVVDVSLQA